MKRKIYLFALLGLFLAATACQDDEETMPVVKPAESGMFVDERDGTEYGWVRIGNREWMTSNMRYEPETGLYGCYEEEGVLGEGSMSDNMFRKNGYYYNYAAAMTVAPQGWRLPTDADWADLERALGMSEPEIGAIGERGTYEGELKQYCKAVVVATKGRNVDSSDCRNPDCTILEASEEGLSFLPYCYFDIDEFYAHPSP